MTLASMRKDVAALKRKLQGDTDVGLIPVIDPALWAPEDHLAYLAAESWDEQRQVIERITGQPLVLHVNTRKNGEPGVSLIEIVLDPLEYANGMNEA